jgi:UDP-2-acetamido-3-amino-2,3-dideoxy-glucuronate N-acetyltransferase
MKNFIHKLSDVQSIKIGENTSIWQFVVVCKNAVIGDNCNICSHCFIENDVIIGDNVTLKFYVEICDGVTLEDDVFIAPNVSFTNDLAPRSKKVLTTPVPTLVKQGASIAAGVSIKPGVTIGRYSFIGLGSVVTKNIPDYTIWYGNPAEFHVYVCQCSNKLNPKMSCDSCGKSYDMSNDEIKEI